MPVLHQIKIDRVYKQARFSGILCAVAHGKLSFCPLTTLRADKKNLPFLEGRDATPKSCILLVENGELKVESYSTLNVQLLFF